MAMPFLVGSQLFSSDMRHMGPAVLGFQRRRASQSQWLRAGLEAARSPPSLLFQSPMFDGKVPHWYHFSCFWKVGHSIRHPDVEVDGFSELRWDDQQKVKKTAEAGGVTGV